VTRRQAGVAPSAVRPRFFASPTDFRAWLEEHHGTAGELWVGFHKKGSGKLSITWPEAVDEALCFGWIDSVRKRIDDTSYANRFSPRRPGSTWSAVNVKRAQQLADRGLMRPAGLAAFRARKSDRSGVYSYEQGKAAALDPADERKLQMNRKAWTFFQSTPPSYRQAAIWWVISAKRQETRQRRLASLIEDSARGRTVRPLTRPTKKPPLGPESAAGR
jgi:uncharacterized protein YdeI (YjbR/CyaY-like superfamily)